MHSGVPDGELYLRKDFHDDLAVAGQSLFALRKELLAMQPAKDLAILAPLLQGTASKAERYHQFAQTLQNPHLQRNMATLADEENSTAELFRTRSK